MMMILVIKVLRKGEDVGVSPNLSHIPSINSPIFKPVRQLRDVKSQRDYIFAPA